MSMGGTDEPIGQEQLMQQDELPTLEEFDDDEQLFARVLVAISRNEKAAMFRGRLIESLVARLLGPGTRFAPLGTWPFDLMTEDGLKVEVKTGITDFKISASDHHDADVWILVPMSGWSSGAERRYLVAHPEFITWARNLSDSLSVDRARELLGEVTEQGLVETVTRVAQGGAGLPPEEEPPVASEPIDRVPGDPALTRWRQAARAHQIR